MPLKETEGHSASFKVNVICADLFSLAIILYSFIHSWISFKLCYSTEDAISGCLLTAIIAVSSANVAVYVQYVATLISRMYKEYLELDPRHFTGLHQILFRRYLYIHFFTLRKKCLSERYDSRILERLYGKKEDQDARAYQKHA